MNHAASWALPPRMCLTTCHIRRRILQPVYSWSRTLGMKPPAAQHIRCKTLRPRDSRCRISNSACCPNWTQTFLAVAQALACEVFSKHPSVHPQTIDGLEFGRFKIPRRFTVHDMVGSFGQHRLKPVPLNSRPIRYERGFFASYFLQLVEQRLRIF
jgi:hypothetical protein